jgi:SAM-dependent methyltransferase
MEVGCGEGGNLIPFAEMGCDVIGVDLDALRVQQAIAFFKERNQNGQFIASDIFKINDQQGGYSLVLMHDVIEHVDDKLQLLVKLKSFLSTDGVLFVAFPAWQMPFGGHQQICHGKLLSHLPFFHLLPTSMYKCMLKLGREDDNTINELLSIKRTKCSIEHFRSVVKKAGFQLVNERFYFINPHYEVKFGLTPRRLSRFIASIPYVRNFFSTSCFYLLK